MMYPFVDAEKNAASDNTIDIPREYGINFETGQLTGKIVEGIEAVKVWAWLALQIPRYRYYVYSWNYGQEYDELVGKGYSAEYMKTELKRMTEECLLQNDYITGIENFEYEKKGDEVNLSFKILTTLGDTEVSIVV